MGSSRHVTQRRVALRSHCHFVVALVLASHCLAAPTPSKIEFEGFLFPEGVTTGSMRSMTACLVNHGSAGFLERSSGAVDHLVLSVPVGSSDSDLLGVGAAMACTPMDPEWSCTVQAQPDSVQLVLAPAGSRAAVGASSTTCFTLDMADINGTEGIAFPRLEQFISERRAFRLRVHPLAVVKTSRGMIRHDDLTDVTSHQHHERYTDEEAWDAVLARDGSGSGLDAAVLQGRTLDSILAQAGTGADVSIGYYKRVLGLSDTESFRRAIADVCRSGGGSIYVPSGRYTLDGPIEVTCPMRISGSSTDSTIIDASALPSNVFALTLNGLADRGMRFRLENFQLTGRGLTGRGIRIYHGISTVLSQIHVTGFRLSGVEIYQTIHVALEHCRISNGWRNDPASSGVFFDARQESGPPDDRGGTNLRLFNTYISEYYHVVEAIGGNVLSVGGAYEGSNNHAFLMQQGAELTSVGDYISNIDSYQYHFSGGALGAIYQPRVDGAIEIERNGAGRIRVDHTGVAGCGSCN